MHDVWLEENNVKGKRFIVATWSDWDCKVMLESECKWKCVQKPPYFNRYEYHISIGMNINIHKIVALFYRLPMDVLTFWLSDSKFCTVCASTAASTDSYGY